jgi:hypothetical protein
VLNKQFSKPKNAMLIKDYTDRYRGRASNQIFVAKQGTYELQGQRNVLTLN